MWFVSTRLESRTKVKALHIQQSFEATAFHHIYHVTGDSPKTVAAFDTELSEKFAAAGLPVVDIRELRDAAEKQNGKAKKPTLGNKEVVESV